MIYSNHNALLEKGQKFQSLIYPHWQWHNSCNNVSKATSEWRVDMSVEPSPLLWFMGGGSNKNGNQISPATLQVVGCLIKLSKAWLGFRMIILRSRKGVHSHCQQGHIHLPLCSYPSVIHIQNNCTSTAHIPLLKVICCLKDSSCQDMMNTMYTDRGASKPGLAGKLTDLWIT